MPSKPNETTTDLNAPRFMLLESSLLGGLEAEMNALGDEWELVTLTIGTDTATDITSYIAGMQRRHR